jgi:hypothetical protein
MRTNKQKNIVFDSKGNHWVFFGGSDGYIHYVVKRGRDDYVNSRLETDKPVSGFHSDIDLNDCIHMIALLTDNTVVYLKYDNDGWNRYILYKFAEASNHIRCPMIMSGNDGLHLFYILGDNAGNSAIFHHVWEKKKWRGYKIFDVQKGEEIFCYDIFADPQGAIYLVTGTSQAVRVWCFTNDRWIKKAETAGQVFSNTSGIVLQEGCVCIRSDEGLFYSEDINRLDTEPPIEIVRSGRIKENPVIINRKKNLSIAWVEDEKLWYRTSYDGGNSWSRVKLYSVQHGPLERYHLINNFTTLFKAKYVIATRPPEIHIPLVHKAMERIRFPEEYFAVDTANQKDIVNKGGLEQRDIDRTLPADKSQPTEKSDKTHCDTECRLEERNPPDGVSAVTGDEIEQKLNRMWQDIQQELVRIKSDMTELRNMLETDIIRRVDSLATEIEGLTKKKEKPADGGRPMNETMGSIISHEMISRYLKRR